MSEHQQFMREAIKLSIQNVKSGKGGPFGAVVVKDGKIVATGANSVTSTNDPTAHAQVVAIRNLFTSRSHCQWKNASQLLLRCQAERQYKPFSYGIKTRPKSNIDIYLNLTKLRLMREKLLYQISVVDQQQWAGAHICQYCPRVQVRSQYVLVNKFALHLSLFSQDVQKHFSYHGQKSEDSNARRHRLRYPFEPKVRQDNYFYQQQNEQDSYYIQNHYYFQDRMLCRHIRFLLKLDRFSFNLILIIIRLGGCR